MYATVHDYISCSFNDNLKIICDVCIVRRFIFFSFNYLLTFAFSVCKNASVLIFWNIKMPLNNRRDSECLKSISVFL